MANKHMVICKECGRQFDASFGAHYDKKSRRYTCPNCFRAKNNKTIWFGQAPWAFILKAFMCFTFVLTAFSPDKAKEGWFSTSVIAMIIGLAFLAWLIIPAIKVKKAEADAEAEYHETMKRIDNSVSICPHCGARTKGTVCEYCGSPLE